MRYPYTILVFSTALMFSASALAQTPAGATALCRDNSYYSGSTHRGACARHGGVQQWLATSTNGAAAPSATPAGPEPASVPAPAPQYPRAAPQYPQYPRAATSPSLTPAAAGGSGQVWVNTATRVYHCPSDRWYGKTNKGEYMSQSQAQAQGYRPDHNKPCPV